MKKWMLGLCALMLSAPAHALFEARLTYTGLVSQPNLDELYDGSLTVPSASANSGLGADALVFIPLSGWGFGLRYEGLGFKADEGALSYESSMNRTALLVTYRFINTLVNVGPTFTYGLSHSGSLKANDGSVSHNWEPGSVSSYSVGLDAGVGLLLFNVGGEVGYQHLKWNDMEDKEGTSSARPSTDMSGSYVKAYIGFGF